MPTGRYQRKTQKLSDAEYIVTKLRRHTRPQLASDLANAVRSRLPQRADFYKVMRQLEAEGRVVRTVSRTGGILYALTEAEVPPAPG
jgi:hypothetical protein